MFGFDSSSRFGMLLFAFVIGANVAIVVHLPARCDLAIPADSILGTATRDMGARRLSDIDRYGSGEGPKAYMLKALLSIRRGLVPQAV